MGIHRIFANCDPQNQSSWRLLETLGFEKEAHLKQNVYFWKDENGKPLWKDTATIYSYAEDGSLRDISADVSTETIFE